MSQTQRRHRGVFQFPNGSGIWWIHWYDHLGRRHRQKIGPNFDLAVEMYRQRKTAVGYVKQILKSYLNIGKKASGFGPKKQTVSSPQIKNKRRRQSR